MSLTAAVRKVVGSIKTSSGRGMSWFRVGDGRQRSNMTDLKNFIVKMTEAFETWKMVRKVDDPVIGERTYVDYHWVIRSIRGNILGYVQTSEWTTDEERFIVGNYIKADRFASINQFHDYNRNYKDVVSYDRVVVLNDSLTSATE